MSTAVKPRRAYVSPHREAGAAATRAAILDAALERFLADGYASTSMERVAAEAGVSAKTVYAIFRNKRALLSAVLDRAIAGDDEPVAIRDRAWVAELAAEPDVERRLRRLGAEGAAILARRATLDALIATAAEVDPEAATLAAETRTARWRGQRALLELAVAPRPVSDFEVDTLFAIGSPETYRVLTVERGWSHELFTDRYAEMLVRLFRDPPPSA